LTTTLVVFSMLAAVGLPAFGQARAGASATIRVGYVLDLKTVELKDDSAAKGALIGGAIGLAAGSGKSGKTRRKRAATGAVVGGVAGSAKKNPTGMQYRVQAVDGAIVEVVTDQMEIKKGDCVAIEEAGGKANIRRIAETACEPESQEVMQDPAIQDEMQEEAAECAAAKDQLLAAETESAIEIAMRKMQILCDD
jgi:outer membrane lipoprotein SlyB